jgi:hypothetical protein
MIKTAMLRDRFESLTRHYSKDKIREISRSVDRDQEFVTFEIDITNGFDVIEIFSAGCNYGIKLEPTVNI